MSFTSLTAGCFLLQTWMSAASLSFCVSTDVWTRQAPSPASVHQDTTSLMTAGAVKVMLGPKSKTHSLLVKFSHRDWNEVWHRNLTGNSAQDAAASCRVNHTGTSWFSVALVFVTKLVNYYNPTCFDHQRLHLYDGWMCWFCSHFFSWSVCMKGHVMHQLCYSKNVSGWLSKCLQ